MITVQQLLTDNKYKQLSLEQLTEVIRNNVTAVRVEYGRQSRISL